MNEQLPIPRLVLGGVSSGVGKTTLCVSLSAALRARGLKVAPFKVGPDYLDPSYHRLATGRRSHNLDGWMMGKEAVRNTFARTARGTDIAIIEGVMGLFDGASATSSVGSSAEIAKWLGAPAVLVVDAGGMARSYAALVQGYRTFDPELALAGSLANRVGSQGHLDLLRSACGNQEGILGGFPKSPELAFPERHLGLHNADEQLLDLQRLAQLAALAEEWIDIDVLLELAGQVAPIAEHEGAEPQTVPTRCRIGIAQDDAFHFYYEENLRLLEQAGAELVPFSPIEHSALPQVDGLYLGGGYPELHASKLAANEAVREEIKAFALAGGPIYAECGGMMYLQESIVTLDGERHPMIGLFDGRAEMQSKRVALGYAEVELTANCLLGSPGKRFRGHQFRYSKVIGCSAPSAYRLRKRRGKETQVGGYVRDNALGSYVHAHWASNPALALEFVQRCTESRTEVEG